MMNEIGDRVRIDRLYVVKPNPTCKGTPYKIGEIRVITKIESGCKVRLDDLDFPVFTWQLSKEIGDE